MKIFINLLENGKLPQKQTPGSSGYDLYSSQEKLIKKGEIALIKLAFKMEIPLGYEGQIRSRSGLALKNGVFVLNAPGTIDSDYKDEVGVILMNSGPADFLIEKEMRIAQIVFAKIESVEISPTNNLISTNKEGGRSGGFGSTGLK